jgi:Domain of unknown function (DUF4440)
MLGHRHRGVLLSLAAVVLSGVFASPGRAQTPKLDEAQAIELEAHFEKALVSGNKPALDSLLADDAVLVASTAELLTKAEFISRMGTAGIRMNWFQKFEGAERKVILTDGGAVVIGKGEQLLGPVACFYSSANSACGGPAHTLYLSTTWAHTSKGWQIVFCQGTLAP